MNVIKFRILYILILSLLIVGCTPKLFVDMQNDGTKQISRSELYPIFNQQDITRMFNMQINYKDNNFSGILIVKPAQDNFLRAIFTTLFGMTVFDFEFNESTFKVNKCMEQLNKKIILNILKKDFRTLFLLNVPNDIKAKVYSKENEIGYKIKTNDGKGYFLTNIAKKELQIVEMPGCFTSLILENQSYEDGFPTKIIMNHPKLKLNLELEVIKQ